MNVLVTEFVLTGLVSVILTSLELIVLNLSVLITVTVEVNALEVYASVIRATLVLGVNS